MDGLNRWQGLGNLGADPELRFTQGGQAVLNLRLACTTSYYDKKKEERVEQTQWFSVVVWGPRGEALSKLLGKGSRVYVEGEMRNSSYEKDGETKWKTECHANEVILCGDKGAGGSRDRDDDRGSSRTDEDRGRGRDRDERSGGGRRNAQDDTKKHADDRHQRARDERRNGGSKGETDDYPF